MNGLLKSLITLGLGAAINYFTTEKPLRNLIRKRRAEKGKGPLLDPAKADGLADDALDAAEDAARRYVP